MHFGRFLAPFWLHVGPFWLPFGSRLMSLGSLLVPFDSLLVTLALNVLTFGASWRHFSYFYVFSMKSYVKSHFLKIVTVNSLPNSDLPKNVACTPIFWDELDCACTLLRLAWRYARIVLTNVFLVHALFAYAACGRNMLTQVWYAFCCNVMLCIYHAIYFSTFVFRHSYVCTEVWSTHCWPVAIVPTGLQYFFCIGSKHNPQEFLTSRFPFSKARCGYIAVGNWDRPLCRQGRLILQLF